LENNSLGLFQLMQLSDMVELARGGNGFEVVPGEVDLLPQEHSYLTRKKRKTRKNIKLKQQSVYIVNPPPPPYFFHFDEDHHR